MSDTVKLIIEIPTDVYRKVHKHKSCIITTKQDDQEIIVGVRKGIPLDDVIGKIDKAYDDLDGYDPYALGTFANRVSDILDNIGKEEKHTCSNCQHRNPVDDNEYRCFMRASKVTRLGSDTCKLWE